MLSAVVIDTLAASGKGFETQSLEQIDLDLEGVRGDSQHYGFTRKAGGREPWHPRGALVANDRQVSFVCPLELATVAERMEIAAIEPGWIGANLVIGGLDRLSFLPRGARLIFPSGATIFVSDQNGPCRSAGAAIQRHVPEKSGLDFAFPKLAQGLRGGVGFIERAGPVRPGDMIKVLLPQKQWLYEPKPHSIA
jgi:MOSC domain-containing protein YiiM